MALLWKKVFDSTPTPQATVSPTASLGDVQRAFTTRTIRSAEFSYESAIERIMALDGLSWATRASDVVAGGEDEGILDASFKRMRLSTMIDTDCRLSVSDPLLPVIFRLSPVRTSLTLSLFRWDVPEP